MSEHDQIKAVLRESIEASLNHISPMAMDFAGPYIDWLIESALYSLDANGWMIAKRPAHQPHPTSPAPAAAVASASGAATGKSHV